MKKNEKLDFSIVCPLTYFVGCGFYPRAFRPDSPMKLTIMDLALILAFSHTFCYFFYIYRFLYSSILKPLTSSTTAFTRYFNWSSFIVTFFCKYNFICNLFIYLFDNNNNNDRDLMIILTIIPCEFIEFGYNRQLNWILFLLVDYTDKYTIIGFI